MVRNILAVIIGYVGYFILVFVTFSALYLVLGPEQTFVPGKFDVTMTWVVPSVALMIVCGIAGGFVAAMVGTDSRVGMGLAITILVLGIAMTLPDMLAAPPTGARDPNLGNWDAMLQARTPLWVLIANPVVAALGALIGSSLRRK